MSVLYIDAQDTSDSIKQFFCEVCNGKMERLPKSYKMRIGDFLYRKSSSFLYQCVECEHEVILVLPVIVNPSH
jgi:hypothetical protein